MAKAAVSSLAAKLGKAGIEAFNECKDDEIVVGGGGECPPIPNGIAQLVDIHVGEFQAGANKGKPFAYLGGSVVEPKFVMIDGSKIPAAGCQTNQTIPLCDTTKSNGEVVTFKQNYARFLNEVKKLGLDTKGMKGDNLDAAIAALVTSAPFFRFNTTKSEPTEQYPNPRTFHNWGLAIEDYESNIDPDAGVVEETTEAAPKVAEKKTATTAKPETKAVAKKGAKAVEEVPFGDDLDMTADKADGGDTKAITFLTQKAREVGYSDEEIESTSNWGEVATLIREKESGEASDEATEEEAEEIDYSELGENADNGDEEAGQKISDWASENGVDVNDHSDKTWVEFVEFVQSQIDGEEETSETITPEKGNVYMATLGTNKKPSQVEIVAVFEDKQTCNVKDLSNNKPYKNIPWASLSEVS